MEEKIRATETNPNIWEQRIDTRAQTKGKGAIFQR
jgi:hypothetical protein